jgi:hypothetical protein
VYKDNLFELIGRQVRVNTFWTTYLGKLMEVSEDDIFIQGEVGWVQIRLEEVTGITPAD